MIKKIFAFAALASVMFSCSTDFDVIDEWKETTVVYGVLDPNDTVQYIKVTKAFLGEGDALAMAQQFDSLYYDTTQLVVTLTEVQTGITDTLTPDMSIPKETTGDPVFGSQQVLYKTSMPLNDDLTYSLKVKNKVSGNEVSSQTTLVNPVAVSTPQAFSSYVDFVNPPNADFKVKWTTSKNGRRYQLVMRFHYEEKNKTTLAIDTTKYVDMVFPDQTAPNLSGGSDMEVGFERSLFFRTLANSGKITVDPNMERHPRGIEFIFYIAGDDLNTYIEVNKPSTGIVQEKPSFTNINNGIGIFSSRLHQRANNKRYNLSVVSEDSLCIGRFTKMFNFCNPSEFNPADPCFCN